MTITTMRHLETEELASRESNGIHVALIWSRVDDMLSVTVRDDQNGTTFELPVGDASPLDVFNHPFAYAAYRGIDCGEPALEAIAA